MIDRGENGFNTRELDDLLGVETKRPLRQLHRNGKINRAKFDGTYVYFSRNPHLFRSQKLVRSSLISQDGTIAAGPHPDEVKAAIILFFSVLDEKQRRLFAGLESFKRGHGGDRFIAQLIGLDPHTVAKGRRELLDDDIDLEGVRQKGGGRKLVEKKRPKPSRK